GSCPRSQTAGRPDIRSQPRSRRHESPNHNLRAAPGVLPPNAALIATMKDRAQQALHLLALDPVVETKADGNSYGFRQQRSCADAIGQCFIVLGSANPQWILEGDIKSCFDRLSQDWLLNHVPMDRT